MKHRYIYLSHFLDAFTPTYGNRDNFKVQPNSEISKGDTANSSALIFSTNHMGTHMDMPFHFCEEGRKLHEVDPEFWVFDTVELIDLPCEAGQIIRAGDLTGFDLNPDMEIFLIRTGFEKFRGGETYWKSNPGVHPEVSDYLRQEFPKLRSIGFDFISITSFEHRDLGKESHRAFLCDEIGFITIVEDMKLGAVTTKIEQLTMAPIFVTGLDASPVTIIARVALG